MSTDKTTEHEEAGEAVVREMIAYIRGIYGVSPTQDQLEHFWDQFSCEVDNIYGQ